MPLELWLAFAGASAVVLVIPGPTILTVISYSIAHGPRANLPLVAAVALGDSTALALSLLGLGALLASSAAWFTLIKWAGGAYLIFLALKMLRAGPPLARPLEAASALPRVRLFANTWLVTALNPKGIVFFIAFLPQFISPAAPPAPQLWVLATTFVVLAAVNAMLYTLFAGAASRILARPDAARGFNLAGGLLLGAAGVWALFAPRQG